MQNVVAVIVTHNRLSLLKEAIDAIKHQTVPVNEIVIINNGSTDGTNEWLSAQQDITIINQANTGGSGGFYTGLKYAATVAADWIWLMDDDTICEQNCLNKLLSKVSFTGAEKIGFICSKIIWKDGMPHNMNLPDVKLFFNKEMAFTSYDQHHVLLAEGCSFVSVLINAEAVKKVGLPYKDFYIWGDDQEYTRRITRAGMLGLYSADSIAVHKTPGNHRAYIYTDSPANLWKHEYGFRNEFFMVRRNKGFLFYLLYVTARVGYGSLKIIKTRKSNRLQFIRVLFRSAWRSFSFHPVIDQV